MVTAYIAVFKDGKQIDTVYPAKWFFRKHEEEPTTEAAIRRTFAEDLHVVLAFQPSDLAAQSASLQIVINPLVDWIWFGFAVMAIGTGIALLPERTLRVRAGEAARGGGARRPPPWRCSSCCGCRRRRSWPRWRPARA